jgi:hypothetical protein
LSQAGLSPRCGLWRMVRQRFDVSYQLSPVRMEHPSLAFFYEIRSADNTVLKRNGGFASQDAAKMAAREDATIMSIAGHVSPRMLAHYSHVRLENRRKALDALSSRNQDRGYVTIHVTKGKTEGSVPPQVVENMVDVTGFEPATPCLQSRCSPS